MTNELAEKPMSYEEMIDTLKGLVFGTFDRTTSKEREALDRAIDLLSNSDEDSIIEDIKDRIDHLHKVGNVEDEKVYVPINDVFDVIDKHLGKEQE